MSLMAIISSPRFAKKTEPEGSCRTGAPVLDGGATAVAAGGAAGTVTVCAELIEAGMGRAASTFDPPVAGPPVAGSLVAGEVRGTLCSPTAAALSPIVTPIP